MEIQVCGHNMSQTASWTCFILLPKQKSIPLALAIAWDFPAQCIQKPQRRKSHAHHEELVNVIGKNSNILSSGLQGLQHKNKHDQWNSATDSCCFFHIQVCKNEAGNFRPWNLQQVLVPTVTSAEGEGVHLFFGARSFLRSMIHRTEPFSCYMFLAVRGF